MKDKRSNGSVPNCLEKEIISRGSNLVHGLTNKQSGNDEVTDTVHAELRSNGAIAPSGLKKNGHHAEK